MVVERVQRVRRGAADIGDARAAIHDLSLRGRLESLGNLCGQFCRFVTVHHTIEDSAMFPDLARQPDYRPVVEKLAAEHRVIHGHLVALDEVLMRLGDDPDALDDLHAAVGVLAADLSSHFAYEEEELAEPMGLGGMRV